MKKKLGFALLAVYLLPGSIYADQTHGWMIALPVCNPIRIEAFKLPPGSLGPTPYVFSNPYRPENLSVRSVSGGYADFGGGNYLYNLRSNSLSCPHREVSAPPQSGRLYNMALYKFGSFRIPHKHKLLVLKGYVNHTESALVRGSVALTTYGRSGIDIPSGMVSLVLLYKNVHGEWQELARITRIAPRSYMRPETWAIQGTVPANTEVKMELQVDYQPLWLEHRKRPSIRIHDARLFGAQCYPDFVNPGQCL